jgi:hypothetical protein
MYLWVKETDFGQDLTEDEEGDKGNSGATCLGQRDRDEDDDDDDDVPL